jgi:hypothetical protein
VTERDRQILGEMDAVFNNLISVLTESWQISGCVELCDMWWQGKFWLWYDVSRSVSPSISRSVYLSGQSSRLSPQWITVNAGPSTLLRFFVLHGLGCLSPLDLDIKTARTLPTHWISKHNTTPGHL